MNALLLVGLSSRLADFVQRRLRGAPWEIVYAPDLADADAHLDRGAPEGIVVDLRRRPAADRIAAWRRRGWGMPILVLAGPAGEQVAALDAGATDYLLEPFEPEDVAVRVESRLHPPVALGVTLDLADRVVHLEAGVVRHDGAEVRLSPTERDLLVFLASRPGRTVTKATLLQQVWGYRPGVQSRTVSTTMARLRSKVEADPSQPAHLHAVYGVGYRFEPVPIDPAGTPPTHAVASRFFGRESEIEALQEVLTAGRLVTLTGTGGVGKTRLAREIATRMGGAWFCDLSEARDPDGICRGVAAGLGVSLGRSDPTEQLAVALAERHGALIVLDNLEQVAAHTAQTLGRWVPRAPHTRFLVTSRVPLRLTGERLFPVDPLPLPPADADPALLERNAASALFLDRARAARPDLKLEGVERDVGAVVRMLDGLPLALELAAARVRVLPIPALRERLSEPLDLLSAPRADASRRQATLRAAIDWSWDLLAPDERRVFTMCSVFAGGFSLEAAEAVLDLPWALDSLQGLVEHGLLRVEPHPTEPRFAWLETLHAYARQKLTGEARIQAEARHGAWFAGAGSAEALDELKEHGGVELTRSLLLDLDNLLAAVARAVARDEPDVAVPCAAAAATGLFLLGPHASSVAMLDRVLGMPSIGTADRVRLLQLRAVAAEAAHGAEAFGADVERALLLSDPDTVAGARIRALKGQVLQATGRGDEARSEGAAALEVLEREGAHWDAARVRMFLGNVALDTGVYAMARACFEQALMAFRELGDRRSEGTVLGNLGILEVREGRLHEAVRTYQRALTIHAEVGNARLEVQTLGNLASAEMALGQLEACERHKLEAIAGARRLGLGRNLALNLGNLGNLRFWQGRFDEALASYGDALALLRQRNEPHFEGIFLGNLANALSRAEPMPVSQERFEQLRARFEQALQMDRRVGNRRAEGLVGINLGDFCRRAGRLDAALAALEASNAVWEELADPRFRGLALCVQAHVLAAAGQVAAARRAVDQGLEGLADLDAPYELADALCRRAGVELAEGDAARARQTAAQVERRVAALGLAGGEVRWLLDELRPELEGAGQTVTGL